MENFFFCEKLGNNKNSLGEKRAEVKVKMPSALDIPLAK